MIGPILHLYLSAPASGGDVLVSGTASGSSTATASAAVIRPVSGQTNGAGAATGDATVTGSGDVLVSGQADGASTAAATASVDRAVSGQADGSSTATLKRGGDQQPGGFVPDWAIRKFWKRVQSRVKKDVRKPKRLRRQGARIRYAEQVAAKAREVAAEIGSNEGVNLTPLPGILYDMMLADITAIEKEMARLDAIVISREAERRLAADDEEVIALLLAEVF